MKLGARRIQAASSMDFSWGVAGVLLARLPSSDSDLPLPLVFAPLGIACGVLFEAHRVWRRFSGVPGRVSAALSGYRS